jgi:DNA-binding helix-hairpin-helix protein with protein kinase domain
MPHIHGGYHLFNAYNPRAKHALRLDWHGQHQVARNLCAALHALHVKGYVMGDVNQKKILVTTQGFVTLVDTDSFQVRAGATVYRCPVGVPEYTPHELHGRKFDQIDRAPVHDRFGLAVLLFQLLVDGYHPFSAVLKNPQDSVPGKVDEWCIRHGVVPKMWT